MPKLVDLDQIKTMLRVTNSHIPSILDLVHVKSGTVHYLTNPTLPSKVEGVGIFTASSDYTAGDTVQINGTTYAVKTMNGTNPPTGMFKSGATVVVGINYQSKSITFKVDGGAGGVDAAGLKLATASVGDVLSGKTFYSGNNSLKTGTRSTGDLRVKSGHEYSIPIADFPYRIWIGFTPQYIFWACRATMNSVGTYYDGCVNGKYPDDGLVHYISSTADGNYLKMTYDADLRTSYVDLWWYVFG